MNRYVKTYYWMFSLPVSRAAIDLFSEIYSFHENKKDFALPFSYFEKKFNLTKRSVIKALDDLVSKKFVIKTKIGNSFNYAPNLEFLTEWIATRSRNDITTKNDEQNTSQDVYKVSSFDGDDENLDVYKVYKKGIQSTHPDVYKVYKKGIQSIPNNTIQDYNKTITKRMAQKADKPTKRVFGEFRHVRLTEKEKERFILEYGEDIFNLCVKKLDEYIEMKGAKYKNHNLVLRGWVLKSVFEKPVSKFEKTKKSNDEVLNNYFDEKNKNDFIEGVVLSVKKIEEKVA